MTKTETKKVNGKKKEDTSSSHMYSYISADKPNRVRQYELDLAKCIALFLMVACHCGMYFFEEGTTEQLIFDMLGGEFAAPVFMVIMGIGVVYSHHNKPELLINRGLKIMIIGYVLNFIRATIPEIICSMINPTCSYFGVLVTLLMVDILPFAGLAMILMGLLKRLKVEPVYQVLIGLLMVGVGEILAGVSTGSELIDAFCSLIWGASEELSYFPLLNWFIYPAAGVYFGEILMHCNDKKELYKRLLPIGAVGVILAYYNMFTNPDYYILGSYYFMGVKSVVFGLCFPMFLFSMCYFITYKKTSESSFVLFSSANLNTIYCISWVLILWIFYFVIRLGGLTMTGPLFTVLLIFVFVFSYIACYFWKKRKVK